MLTWWFAFDTLFSTAWQHDTAVSFWSALQEETGREESLLSTLWSSSSATRRAAACKAWIAALSAAPRSTCCFAVLLKPLCRYNPICACNKALLTSTYFGSVQYVSSSCAGVHLQLKPLCRYNPICACNKALLTSTYFGSVQYVSSSCAGVHLQL